MSKAKGREPRRAIPVAAGIRAATMASETDLALVFGPPPGELDVVARATSSGARFVRSHAGLSRADGRTCGREITARQALDAFGWDVLVTLALADDVPLTRPGFEASAVLPGFREAAGLTVEGLADLAGVSAGQVEAAEAGTSRVPMTTLERIALALGLCPIRFGAVDSRIGVDVGPAPGPGATRRKARPSGARRGKTVRRPKNGPATQK